MHLLSHILTILYCKSQLFLVILYYNLLPWLATLFIIRSLTYSILAIGTSAVSDDDDEEEEANGKF